MTHPPAGPSTPTPPPGPKGGKRVTRMRRIPTWVAVQAFQFGLVFVLFVGGLVVVQADRLGHLPASVVPWTPSPSVMHPAVEGMGRSPRAALLDAIEAERWRAER